MAKTVEPAIEKTIKLIEWDPEGDDEVVIKQATGRESRIRDDHFSKISYRQRTDGIERILDWSAAELVIKECWLTTVDCNIKIKRPIKDKPGETEEVRMFNFPMQYEEFKAQFDKITDTALIEEWHDAVLKVNPKWDPNGGVEEVVKN